MSSSQSTQHSKSIYEGSFLNGKKHGQGKLLIQDRLVYEGEFQNNMFHGQGTIKFANQHTYTGQWVNNCYEGIGTYTFCDKRVIIGTFKAGKCVFAHRYEFCLTPMIYYIGETNHFEVTGYGKLCLQEDVVLEGWFEHNKPVGIHCMTLHDKTQIVGTFTSISSSLGDSVLKTDEYTYYGPTYQGSAHGVGKMIFHKSKIIYEGEFTNNSLSGKGKITYPTQHVYEGEIVKYKRHGYGILRSTNPDDEFYFEGHFKFDKEDGFSTCEHDGIVHTGEFKQGKKEGIHHIKRVIHGEEHLIEATFQNDEIICAKHTIPSKKYTYVGEFVNLHKHGFGKERVENEYEYEGYFQKGKRHGHGKYTSLINKFMYEGEWKDNKMNGHGHCVSKDGHCIITGTWQQGVLDGKCTKYFPKTNVTMKLKYHNKVQIPYGVVYKPREFLYMGQLQEHSIHGLGSLFKFNHNSQDTCVVFIGRMNMGRMEGNSLMFLNEHTYLAQRSDDCITAYPITQYLNEHSTNGVVVPSSQTRSPLFACKQLLSSRASTRRNRRRNIRFIEHIIDKHQAQSSKKKS